MKGYTNDSNVICASSSIIQNYKFARIIEAPASTYWIQVIANGEQKEFAYINTDVSLSSLHGLNNDQYSYLATASQPSTYVTIQFHN